MTRPHDAYAEDSPDRTPEFFGPLPGESPSPCPLESDDSDANAELMMTGAIAEWKAAVPRVALADRVLSQWQAERPRPQRVAASTRLRWIAWGASVAACVAVLIVATWPQSPVQPGGGNPSLAARPMQPTPSPAPSGVDAVDRVSPVSIAANESVEAGSVTTALVGDVRAAMRDLTSEAAAPVADLLAMAWSKPNPLPTTEATGERRGWKLTAPPLERINADWKPITRPLGAAVDFLLDRLDAEEHGAS
jgi:hypothetical protein